MVCRFSVNNGFNLFFFFSWKQTRPNEMTNVALSTSKWSITSRACITLLLFNIFYLRASLSDKKFTNDFTLPVRNIFFYKSIGTCTIRCLKLKMFPGNKLISKNIKKDKNYGKKKLSLKALNKSSKNNN